MAVLGLSNVMRNAAVGGNKEVGCTDFYMNTTHEEYPNELREDEHSWVLIVFCPAELQKRQKELEIYETTRKRSPLGKAKLLQISMENQTSTRIFAGKDCPLKRVQDAYTLYWNDGYVVSMAWDEQRQNWKAMLRNHKCHKSGGAEIGIPTSTNFG